MKRARVGVGALLVGLVAGGAVALPACGGGQTQLRLFGTNWQNDDGKSIEAVRQRLAGAPLTRGVDVVVGVAGNTDAIVGISLGQASRWTFAHPLDARPIVSTTVVVGSGGGELFALDALTGHKLWARPTGGLQVHAAGDDGTVTVVTLARAGATDRAGTTMLAVTHDGTVVRQIETGVTLGAPAVVARLAFVPWDNEYVSVLDLSDGSEPGRVLLRDKTSRAWTVGGALYFGEIAAVRFDDRIKDASRHQASRIELPARELPGSPKLFAAGEAYVGPSSNATDKIHLYARPSGPSGALAWDSGRFYATYFRIIMGLSSDKGGLAWVHTQGADVLAGAAASGALVVCDEGGAVTVLDAKEGAVTQTFDLGGPVKSCAVQVDAFREPPPRTSPGPLASQIETALADRDLELANAQRLLLRELGTLDDENVTETLIHIASDPRTSPALLSDARAELGARRTGLRFMRAALAHHYDYLKDELRPPPVGPMADALAAAKDPSAAPLLVAHLFDPADTDDDVRRAALALATLATAREAPDLARFLAMYRGAPDDPESIPSAVVGVAQALLRVGGPSGRAAVERAASSGLTNPAVKEKLAAVVHAADAVAPSGR